jgi:hypothetical protein
MASTAIRERRRTLRYRSLLVRQMVQMKIKITTLLMEAIPRLSGFCDWSRDANRELDRSECVNHAHPQGHDAWNQTTNHPKE